MSRRSERKKKDELRSRFVANRERVRAWTAAWDCPEIEWPPFSEIPSPWVVLPDDEESWLEHHAPWMDDYRWFLHARPRATGIAAVTAEWWFGAGHEFKQLEIEFRSVADPPYVAEKLALAADAAALKGWERDDVQLLYTWLLEGLDSRPLNEAVHGNKRTGFVLFDILRVPSGPDEIASRLRMTLTTTTLDGRPLNDQGRPQAG